MSMRMETPPNALVWRKEYSRWREDDRETYRAVIVDDYPDDEAISLEQFVQWINLVFFSIPEEWRNQAVLKLGRDDSECGTAADFEVYIDRPENDAEYANRKAKKAADEEAAKREQEARERGMLEALRKKYGG